VTRAVLADTGPLYAAVDPDDQYHARSQEQLQALADEGLSVVLAYPILLETYTLIRYRLGSISAWINPSPQDYREAAAWVGRFPDQSITLFDATLAVVASRLRLPVGPMITTSTRWELQSGVEHGWLNGCSAGLAAKWRGVWFRSDDGGLVAINAVSMASNLVSGLPIESDNPVEKGPLIAVQAADDCCSLQIPGLGRLQYAHRGNGAGAGGSENPLRRGCAQRRNRGDRGRPAQAWIAPGAAVR
jgi:predicted nucleic acid-binding protein